jgi:drug/metabolite transporter (DMT)-like permease
VPELAGIGRGDLLTLFCSIAFALHCLTLSRVSARVPFRALALLQIGTATLFMAASLPWLERPAVRWTPAVLAALAISAVLGTAAAFSIQSWVQTILPATHTALILALEPVFAWLTSFLLLGERLGGRAAAGAGLILAGIVATEALAPRAAGTAHEGTAAPPDTPARPAAL